MLAMSGSTHSSSKQGMNRKQIMASTLKSAFGDCSVAREVVNGDVERSVTSH